MSIDCCGKCGKFIDTDYDVEAYEVTLDDGSAVNLDYTLCAGCKDAYQGIAELKKRVDQFASDIFDYVSMLGHTEYLAQTYQFRNAIDEYLNPKRLNAPAVKGHTFCAGGSVQRVE